MCVFDGKLTITRKRWEIRPRLLLIANWKCHTPFQIKWKSLTLYSLEGHWQTVRSAILATAGFLVSICNKNLIQPHTILVKVSSSSIDTKSWVYRLARYCYKRSLLSSSVSVPNCESHGVCLSSDRLLYTSLFIKTVTCILYIAVAGHIAYRIFNDNCSYKDITPNVSVQ